LAGHKKCKLVVPDCRLGIDCSIVLGPVDKDEAYVEEAGL